MTGQADIIVAGEDRIASEPIILPLNSCSSHLIPKSYIFVKLLSFFFLSILLTFYFLLIYYIIILMGVYACW